MQQVGKNKMMAKSLCVTKYIICDCRELHLAILCSALLQNYMYVFKGK